MPGIVLTQVEINAFKDGEFWIMRAFAGEVELPEYVAICRLAE